MIELVSAHPYWAGFILLFLACLTCAAFIEGCQAFGKAIGSGKCHCCHKDEDDE